MKKEAILVPKINETFLIGDQSNLDEEKILILMQEMYRDLAIAINRKPDIIQRTTDGLVTDSFLSNGDININLNTNKVQMLTNHATINTVIWTTLS